MSFSEAVPYDVTRWYCECFPCFNQYRVHVVRLKPRGTILQHPLSLQKIVERLQFWVRPVVIGLVVVGVTRFKYKGLNVFALHLCPGAVVEGTTVSIEEEYLIFDRGGAAYVGELGHGLKPPVYIHVTRWCVMDCPVKWGVVAEILGVLLGLVNNNGRYEEFTISSCEYK